jgi:hypothetical protein
LDGDATSSSTEFNSILNILLNLCHTAHSIIGHLKMVHLLQKYFSMHEVALKSSHGLSQNMPAETKQTNFFAPTTMPAS